MKSFLKWLVISSQNPDQIALTIKGASGLIISIVLVLSPLFHLNVGQDQLNSVVDGIIQVITLGATFISAIAMLVGLIRKLFTPQNQVAAGIATSTYLNFPQ